MSDAGESSDDGDGDRVEFLYLYTGQDREEIPRQVTHVRVDPSVKRIGEGAFENCKLLVRVELCEELEEIGNFAFAGCKCLKRFRIPPTVKRIAGYAFAYCEQLQETELCDGLEEIGGCAFEKCKYLKQVRVPFTVKRIGRYAFAYCEQLEEVQLYEGLEEIGDYLFEHCISLKRVRLPPTVKRIGRVSFDHCVKLEEVELCEGLEEIGDYAFRQSKYLKRVRIPLTVKRIGRYAFAYCEQLEEVQLYEGLEEIGDYVFEHCKSLRWVRLPLTVKRMGRFSFGHCTRLEEVELCEGLEEIGDCVFRHCKYLKRIRIPLTSKRIGRYAFAYCEQLEEVQLYKGLEEIGDYVFEHCKSLKRVRLPLTVKRMGRFSFDHCARLEEVELCEGLEEVGDYTFRQCKYLKWVQIPLTVKRIGKFAFEGCKQLEDVELCEGLEEIDGCAFHRCPCLKHIKIPHTVKKIGKWAFVQCEQLEGVELCEGLEEIGDGAFEKCASLRNISIPSSLNLIGAHVFRGCLDIRKLFDSQNMIVNALKCRLEGLPVHQLCYYQSAQPAQLIFEQLQNVFDMMSDQVEAPIPAESSPAQTAGNGKATANCSGSSQKLKVRCHVVGRSDVASGSAMASGAYGIDRNQDCLGMTPLHILACSTKQNLGFYQLIISKQPKCLITKDKWGCLPVFYAIWGSCSPEILQFLIDSQKSAFPDIDLNWDMMVSSLCRASAPLDLVQRLLKVKQASFPEQSISFQRIAQELTIHCLVGSDSFDKDPFDEDFPSRWESMMEVFSNYHTQQGLLVSLLEIQQSFFPNQTTTRWQALCEEFVKPLKGWWNPESTAVSSSMFQFLVRCSIPERLYAIRVRKWQKNIERLVERNNYLPLPSNHMDTIHSMLVFYECQYPQLKEKTALIELALWKSKMGESVATQHNKAGPGDTPDELSPVVKAQCRINCGAEIIILNVLPYLIADAEKDNVSGADGDMDKSSSM